MARTVEFLFDFASPNAYLAWRALPGMLAGIDARVELVPCLLGGLFKLTGNQAPMTAFAGVEGKLAYERLEMQRFITKHRLEAFRFNPHFPINTLQLMRGMIAARRLGTEDAYVDTVLKGMWEDERDMADLAVVADVLAKAGLDAGAIQQAAQNPDVKAELAQSTERAAKRGAFGVPTFFVGDEMFFGKERLAQLVEALDGPEAQAAR